MRSTARSRQGGGWHDKGEGEEQVFEWKVVNIMCFGDISSCDSAKHQTIVDGSSCGRRETGHKMTGEINMVLTSSLLLTQ